jgi:PilZ domain
MVAPFRTSASDISPGGCYVETMFTLEIGTTLTMKLWLDKVRLSTTGIVTTCHPQVGNGIQFTNIDDEDVRRLEQFLADHAVAEESRPAS